MFKWFWTIFSLGAPGLGSRHWQLFPCSLAAAFAVIVQLLLYRVVQYNREDVFFCFFLARLDISFPKAGCWKTYISLRASSPFGGYREKLTPERTRESPSRLRRSLSRSRAAHLARPNRRACSQARKYIYHVMISWRIFWQKHRMQRLFSVLQVTFTRAMYCRTL